MLNESESNEMGCALIIGCCAISLCPSPINYEATIFIKISHAGSQRKNYDIGGGKGVTTPPPTFLGF